ncbi:DUF4344 domain-containing metallopeptidase [Stutzerimonas stutzeri]|uniref:DUF4344 domain-containing metallopeptidase n=1 Tax=Stutzerimonas stutzeri TaxID=316 RepID=UPI000F76B448|nr:DUF4344 domain-containing metallopeptidase [Stutzerimonas stutzeri]MDH0425487.1 DUF4344 domain-containing metallopeptidase [Stutzerimonas stutzeri]RRV31471.1 hypothetical protein EGI94_15725 [Stutzerimonas stutzeri]RRV55797.1 hypothetical protein EGJ19_04325 [Stutzerimonas stutzeri]RRV62588.1 hypothetical protein EGJ08_00160 [Stutzerimonas stutzeri]RSH65161.1 hypothetical protein EGV02_16345 [Stutzerimonas stutzeri]
MSRFAWLLWLLPMLAPAQDGGTAPELSVEAVRFTVANAEFTLMHEMGHLLISELQLPVLGREEDAADQLGFMGLFLLQQEQHRDDFYAKLMDVADYCRMEWQNAERDGSPVPVWDSHALDAQRFYNIACLAYGSDPDRLDWVLEVSGLPVERALYCPDEYEQVAHAVQWFREHFGRSAAQPLRHRIKVVYDTPPAHLAGGTELLEKIRASGELEAVAAKASEAFALPRDLTLRMSTCGAPDAWFNRISGELTLCYERIAYFRDLAAELPSVHQAAPAAPAAQ